MLDFPRTALRLRGDDSGESLLHIFFRRDERKCWMACVLRISNRSRRAETSVISFIVKITAEQYIEAHDIVISGAAALASLRDAQVNVE